MTSGRFQNKALIKLASLLAISSSVCLFCAGCGEFGVIMPAAGDSVAGIPKSNDSGGVALHKHQAIFNESITKEYVESAIRQQLKNSQITSLTVALTAVRDIDASLGGDPGVATLTLDSLVWVVTTAGSVVSPFGKQSRMSPNGQTVFHETQSSKAVFAVSVEDGSILSGITYQ